MKLEALKSFMTTAGNDLFYERIFTSCIISRTFFTSAFHRCDAWLLLGIKVADPEGEVTQFSDVVVVSITGWVDKDVLSDLPS